MNNANTKDNLIPIEFDKNEIPQFRVFSGYAKEITDEANSWIKNNIGLITNLKRSIYPFSHGMNGLLTIIFEFNAEKEDLEKIVDDEKIMV
jgi:hypothetical protein